MERYRGYLALTVVYLFILAGAAYYFGRPEPASLQITSPTPLPEAGKVVVYVSGAVAQPGVYTLEVGARLAAALDAAGGALEGAELAALNLAERLRDGEHIHVPRQGEGAPASLSSSGGRFAGKIDINWATAKELDDALPGIGPVLAGRIVAYREKNGPFSQIEDLRGVSGIGPATFEKIKDLVMVR